MNLEVQSIGELIDKELQSLNFDNSVLLGRFDKRSAIYPYIESLGPATNLQELQQYLPVPDNAAEQEKELETTIAALRADVVGQQISIKSRLHNVLTEAFTYTTVVREFSIQNYSSALTRLSDLHSDQRSLRDSLFAAANLPADPEQTWEDFIRSGQEYRSHLDSLGVHDDTRCLYCRQLLGADAFELIFKYREYLESQIAKNIESQESVIHALAKPLLITSLATVQVFSRPADSGVDEGIAAPYEPENKLRHYRA